MKMIQRYSVYVLLLAVAVSLSSCRRAVEILADWEHKGESLLAPED